MWGIGRAVEIDETQIAFVGRGKVGGGTLRDQGIQH